ncbi:hypothetical protein DBV15_04217 [Temnothorax longispinosus]|uniref:Uncharacterized protein n=1 Tax=Temnothorax longispinosus TaxID=300112 RepID=A0A4S2KDU9_9HYME|nr:hypothetical protein DBV15_04217 [Temnothorax longispinosus]
MDGNRRYANKRNIVKKEGHSQGYSMKGCHHQLLLHLSQQPGLLHRPLHVLDHLALLHQLVAQHGDLARRRVALLRVEALYYTLGLLNVLLVTFLERGVLVFLSRELLLKSEGLLLLSLQNALALLELQGQSFLVGLRSSQFVLQLRHLLIQAHVVALAVAANLSAHGFL